MKSKTEDVYEDFSNDKEMFNFSNYSTKSKCYNDWNKLVFGEMKYEICGVAIEEFVRLKIKKDSLLMDGNRKHEKTRDVNRNVVPTVSHDKYKDVLLNSNSLRHSMNRIQIGWIGTYEINKISLSSFDDKIYIQDNRYDGLALGY